MIHPVILSGGSGTRLWPMSRTLYPKQLLSLLGQDSLLQETVRRVADRQGFAAPLLVANVEHRFIIAEQLREIAAVPRALLLEPVGRNTAPAACIAALALTEAEPEPLMLLMPSYHTIGDPAAFADAVERAATAARAGALTAPSANCPTPTLTALGVRPSTPIWSSGKASTNSLARRRI